MDTNSEALEACLEALDLEYVKGRVNGFNNRMLCKECQGLIAGDPTLQQKYNDHVHHFTTVVGPEVEKYVGRLKAKARELINDAKTEALKTIVGRDTIDHHEKGWIVDTFKDSIRSEQRARNQWNSIWEAA